VYQQPAAPVALEEWEEQAAIPQTQLVDEAVMAAQEDSQETVAA
jgi:hypothetical protein